MSQWIRKGDLVKVIAGNSKGQSGEVVTLRGDRVVIKGVNKRIRHMKPRSEGVAGQRVEFEAPLHVSNVQLVGADGQAVQLRVTVGEDGSRSLVNVANGQEILWRVLRKAQATVQG